jgi:hypothetical protein
MKPELNRNEMPPAERDLRARAAQLLQGAGLLHGNLIERETVCGNPTCKCTRGERHQVLHLHRRRGGKLHQLYIPRYLEETVRRWLAQDHELREVLAQLADVEWEKVRAMKTRKK